ncbi:MAG: methyltransferase [Verrucomicrobiaceae bacterium]|nr:methyltransferase [Verrucomicrobiaceae bacterium]
MPTDLTAAPATDPLRIYQYRDCLYAADLIAAALVHLDFFSWLARTPSDKDAICAHFGTTERPTDVMLTLFAANGFIENRDGTFHATTLAREHLSKESPWNLGPYYDSLHSRPIAKDFLEVLRTDKPAGWSGDKASADWHKAMEDETFARRFTAAMDCRGLYFSQALAKKLDLRGRSRFLDIGGGSGIYACSVAAHHAQMRAAVLDQAPVDRIARKLVEERGFAKRVEVIAGNMFDGLPGGFDVHLYSNVLHDWGIPEVQELLAVSHAALPPGGMLIIHDAFINAGKTGPMHVAEYSALLMHSTQGKCYSTAEYAALLADAGFEPGPYTDTVAARGFMTATRR